MINGDPLWHVSAIKLWANWSSFNKINGHMVPSILISLYTVIAYEKKVRIITLTSNLEKLKYIEHNMGSKIYPQNQVILDCIMPSIPLRHKCLSIFLIWVIVSRSSGL